MEVGLAGEPIWVRAAASVIRRLPAGRYRLMNRLCTQPPKAFWRQMLAELGGYFFRCDLRDSIAREVCFTGRYEPQETVLVREVLKPGMTFVDVGANWGYFTLLAAHLVGATGRVLSLEPDPRMFALLRDNVTHNRLTQVKPLPIAAAAGSGRLTLTGYEETDGNFGISRIAPAGTSSAKSFEVETDSLDHLLDKQQLDSVDLMKMDIEGGEIFALKGLQHSLAAGKIKRLLLELHPIQLAEHGATVNEVMRPLLEAGYSPLTIDHSSAATRKAAYGRVKHAGELIRPLTFGAPLDAWPHQLWLSPGTKLVFEPSLLQSPVGDSW